MFECIVCGSHFRVLLKVLTSAMGAVPVCGARCRLRFLTDPLAYFGVLEDVEIGVSG